MTRKLIDEVKEYERQRERGRSCGLSTVQPVNCIVLNGITHSFDISNETAAEIRAMLKFLTALSPIPGWDGVEIWSALRGAVEAAGGNADEVSDRRKAAAQ